MIAILLAILVILWLLGYIQIPGITIKDFVLFKFNGHPISLLDILIFVIIVWLIGLLPSPIREIAGILLILWILSTFGILAIAGLSNLIVLALIVGIVVSLFGKRS